MISLILLDPTIIDRDSPIPPVVWNIENGISYEDLKYDRFDEAIQFLIENYVPFETLCRCFSIADDSNALEQFCSKIRLLLKEDCSMVAVDVATRRIIGLAILKIMRAEDYPWTFWRLCAPSNTSVGKMMEFQCDTVNYSKSLTENFDISLALHYFIICVARDMKGHLLKEKLLINAFKIAKSIGASVVTFIATSRNNQERAKRVGLVKIDQKNYGTYVDKNGKIIFDQLDSGEHFAELYCSAVGPRTISSIDNWILYSSVRNWPSLEFY